MRAISISKRKFENLEVYRTTDINTEAVLYDFSYHGEVKLLKKLYINDGINFARKLYTIELLNSVDLPDYFVVPDNLVTVDNKVVGFTISKISGVTLKSMLDNCDFPLDVKIDFLKRVGLVLENMIGIKIYHL